MKRLVPKIIAQLRRNRDRLVLAESCTGGLLASLFTEIPGVSEVFCGSHVVYRDDSKRRWIGVKSSELTRFSAVSPQVAEAMARGALRRTPEATIAGSVTGYLGPGGKRVGLVYFSVIRRRTRVPETLELEIGPLSGARTEARLRRREIAAEKLLATLLAVLTRS